MADIYIYIYRYIYIYIYIYVSISIYLILCVSCLPSAMRIGSHEPVESIECNRNEPIRPNRISSLESKSGIPTPRPLTSSDPASPSNRGGQSNQSKKSMIDSGRYTVDRRIHVQTYVRIYIYICILYT